jgi:hypothetical protein
MLIPEHGGLKAKIIQRTTPAIVQGEDAFLVVQVYYAGSAVPYAFYPPVLGATGYFPPATGTVPLAATGWIGSKPEEIGTIRLDLDKTFTAGLNAGESQNIQLNFEDQYGLTIILMEESLAVVPAYYPPS